MITWVEGEEVRIAFEAFKLDVHDLENVSVSSRRTSVIVRYFDWCTSSMSASVAGRTSISILYASLDMLAMRD